MRKLTRLTCLLVVLVMVGGLISTASAEGIDTSEFVNINMYLIGEPGRDYDEMLGIANEKLREDLNASVTVDWLAWGEWETKYPLLLASGEPIDLIYAAYWTKYTTEARKGAYLALEDLLPIYAPKSNAELTDDFRKQSLVDGHLYALPAAFYQYNTWGHLVRGDLMDKYGMTTIDNFEQLGEYLQHVVDENPEFDPTGLTPTYMHLARLWAQSHGLYSEETLVPFFFDIETAKVVNFLDLPGIEDFYALMKEWGDKGYWPKSVLANKDANMFREGLAASYVCNHDGYPNIYLAKPEYDPRYFLARDFSYKTNAMQDAMAIPASAKNPERALMFLELLRTNETYYNLFTYGIEGKHFEILEDGRMRSLPDVDGFNPEHYCSWGFKSPNFARDFEGFPPDIQERRAYAESIGKEIPFTYFFPNLDPVKNEYAAVVNVMAQYGKPLELGYVDPVEGYAELMSQLKSAGADKVQEELQRQLDEFMNNL